MYIHTHTYTYIIYIYTHTRTHQEMWLSSSKKLGTFVGDEHQIQAFLLQILESQCLVHKFHMRRRINVNEEEEEEEEEEEIMHSC